ncbi:MAG: hypothetical protein AAF327_10165 [Cyanobacteria bacterium P01_A01_bin.37]
MALSSGYVWAVRNAGKGQAKSAATEGDGGGRAAKLSWWPPECPEGSDVQVIVLLSSQPQSIEPEQPPAFERDALEPRVPEAIASIQAMVRRYVSEGHSLV